MTNYRFPFDSCVPDTSFQLGRGLWGEAPIRDAAGRAGSLEGDLAASFYAPRRPSALLER